MRRGLDGLGKGSPCFEDGLDDKIPFVQGGNEFSYNGFIYSFSNTGNYAVTARRNLPGDVNMDEKRDIFDVLKLLGYIARKDYAPALSDPADVDENGKIDIFDLLALLSLLRA